MNFHSPRLVVLALCAASLSGCASVQAPLGTRAEKSANDSARVARSWDEIWGRVKQAVRIGKAADERFLAARDNNVERFTRAQRDLALLQLYSPAEAEVMRARAWSIEVGQAAEPREKAQLEKEEAAAYKRALEMSPQGEFSSRDPELLNALGYFLADKGRTRGDFERAERLSRQALSEHEKAVKEARQQGERSAEFLSARYSRANTRDSLAWALYKQATVSEIDRKSALQLLEEARREQQAALDEARQSLSALGSSAPKLSAELPYHLAMILRAQNVLEPKAERAEAAQALLREAVALDPKLQVAREVLAR